jgi:single-strand DNA-binding protein
VILIGNLGRDPEITTFENGVKKASFSIATTETYKNREGQKVDQTEWHNITGFRYLAEKNFAKGDLVYVEGKIKTRKYTDKEGADRYITEIIADKINILSRKSGDSYSDNNSSNDSYRQDTPSDADLHNDAPDDDLPF